MKYTLGIRKTRNTDDSLGSGTKLFIPSLSLGFWHEERERDTIFLCWLFVHRQLSTPWPNRRTCAPRSPPRSGPKNQLATSQSKSQLPTFFQNHQESQPIASGHDVIHIPSLISFWGFYCDICVCHILPTRAWTPALMSAPTYALSRKVLSLTKPKDKIYKTKNDNIKKISLRNYIRRLHHVQTTCNMAFSASPLWVVWR